MEFEQELEVERAQKGSHEAFIHLTKPLELQMYNIAKAIVRQDEDCADAMQEAILKAYKSIANLRNPSFFKTWLFRILINECNTILRKRSNVVSLFGHEDAQSSTPNTDLNIDLREAVYRLEEVSRTIVILHYFRDLPLRQIAEMLDLNESTVKTRLHRARTTLSQWLANHRERKINV
ncbi:RNA polymerase sigma-70 factor, ECF subfamily [Paenibacillus uliginis N3/975]|uniref:RNA polymerase sigma-70 factor, ECF subfamily n=1 Tax=Paenibacillus uliginis N3/975 TaxID=1313296 RepID=A0A1X7HRI9_9BACL|nr:sigma-70 family RNA polymerase sigma factor [Paenibacillus uliginis]SMF91653.1 RNA polymerase sigma-70 factor, ECF subfamily [Paenibacillus uliginis N3/975]